METFNNTTKVVKDDLVKKIKLGSKVSIAAVCFSIYAYQTLRDELENCEEFRFIFTSPTFVAEKTLKERKADRRIPVGASSMVWDQTELEARFAALRNTASSAKKLPHVILYILLLTAFVMSYFVIVQPARFVSENNLIEDISVSDISELDVDMVVSPEMYIVFENNEYYLYVDGVAASIVSEENLSVPPFNTLPILEDNK